MTRPTLATIAAAQAAEAKSVLAGKRIRFVVSAKAGDEDRAYAVTLDYVRPLGRVVLKDGEWLAFNTHGRLWSSFGRSRAVAAAALVAPSRFGGQWL